MSLAELSYELLREEEPPVSVSERALELGQLRVPKGSDLLVAHLRELILSGKLAPGEPLPSERAMVEETGLSRTTVREAIRILELDGLVTIKLGRNGGPSVSRPTVEAVSRSLEAFLRAGGLPFDSLIEAREPLEIAAAGIAAKRRTEEDLERIRESNERLRASMAGSGFLEDPSYHWHTALTAATHNELFTAYLQQINEILFRGQDRPRLPKALMKEITDAHDRIYEAIRLGDEDAARAEMARHHQLHEEHQPKPHGL